MIMEFYFGGNYKISKHIELENFINHRQIMNF